MKKLKENPTLYGIVKTHLEEYLGDILKEKNLDPIKCVSILSVVFGKKVLRDIDGFIVFAKNHNLDRTDIRSCLAHDLGGAMRMDKLMLPKVSDYGQYSNIKKETNE